MFSITEEKETENGYKTFGTFNSVLAKATVIVNVNKVSDFTVF